MKLTRHFWRTATMLLLLAVGTVCSATTRKVGQPNTACPNAQYTTITDAVNAASAGDVIEICPAHYAEQLIITMPLTLRGVSSDVDLSTYLPCCNEVRRVLLQPALQDLQGLPFESVITVMNTNGVTIDNLVIDASQNTVSGCDIALNGVTFYNASGRIRHSTVQGAQLPNPQSCAAFLGNGYGVVVTSSDAGPHHVEIENNSIHDYQRAGVGANNTGVSVEIENNSISGIGPSIGIPQFGVFLFGGAVGDVEGNIITEGPCGFLSSTACTSARSEGVVLRLAGDGTVVNQNVISHVQSGVFLNTVNNVRVTNNLISNIDLLDGIDMYNTSNSLIDSNTIFNATPLANLSEGIFEAFGGSEGYNQITSNTVNDAYCGVAFVATSHVRDGSYSNVLYPKLLSNGQNGPPPTEPPLR